MTSVLCKEAGESFSRPASGSFPLLPGTGTGFLRSWPRSPKETGARVTTIGKGEKDPRTVLTLILDRGISVWTDAKADGLGQRTSGGRHALFPLPAAHQSP